MIAARCRRAVAVAVAVLLALGAGGGCGETPTQGFEDFYGALVAGDARVLDRLDSATRRRVEEAARAQGLEPARALAGAGVRSTLRAIRERERTDARATLEVEDALGTTEVVTMVVEQGRWRVVLATVPPAEVPPVGVSSP